MRIKKCRNNNNENVYVKTGQNVFWFIMQMTGLTLPMYKSKCAVYELEKVLIVAPFP